MILALKSESHSTRQQLWRLMMLAVFAILIWVSPRPALAQAAKTAGELLSVLKGVPGLSNLPVSDIRKSGDSVSAKVTLYGKSMRVVGFKVDGVSMGAVVPDSFKLTDLAPVPRGTPIDGISFKDMAFVYVPKGKAKSNIASSKFPESVRTAVNHFGTQVSLKVGFNLFGQANFSSAEAIKKVFSAIGHTNYSLPLSAAFPADIFKTDIKSASAKLKKDRMGALSLTLPLPKNFKIHGMPNVVSVKAAQIIVIGREVKGKATIYAGVTGDLDVNIKGSSSSFSFGMLAAQPGAKFSPKITADSKKGTTLTVNLIKEMTLSDISFEATKKNNKWNFSLLGDTKIGKKDKVSVYYFSNEGTPYIGVNTKMTLAETIDSPGLPGLDDIQFEWMQIWKNQFTMALKVKGIDSQLSVFKAGGLKKPFISWVAEAQGKKPSPINPALFIPGAEHTPLKDVTFQDMAFVYNPNKTAAKLKESDLPGGLPWTTIKTFTKSEIKSGLNIFGKMNAHPTGEMAKMLKHVGINDLSLPLSGGFSTKAFSKNLSGAAIKKEILDNLDIKIPLPKINMPGLSKVANIRHTVLAIKGKKEAVDASISGELDVKIGSKEVVLDYYVDVVKKRGKPSTIVIKADEAPGKKVTIDLVARMELTNFSFEMKKSGSKWNYSLLGDTKIGKKDKVSVYYISNGGNPYVGVNTKMTLAETIDSPGLPGLDDIQFEWMQIWKNQFTMALKVKGIDSQLSVFKAGGLKKHFISWVPEADGKSTPITPAQFIPGAEKTPLNDVSFLDMAFVYSPSTSAIKIKTSDLPGGLPWSILSPLTKSSLKPGLNVFGHMKVHPSGEMETLLKKVGIATVSMPLNGKFSPKVFAKNTSGTAVKNAILDELDLDIKLPALHVPAVSSFLTFKNGRLKIKGKTPKGVRGVDVGISGDADVHVKHEQIAFNVDVEYDKAGGTSDLSFKGHTDESWTHPMGIKFLDLESLSVTIDKKKKKNGTKLFDISMAAKSDVGSHSKLDVTVDVHEKNGKVIDAFFELDGPLKLSDIPDVKDIPNSDHFTIDTIKVSEHGIEAKVAFGGKKDLDAYMFESPGWNLIVRQDNFAITEFVPPLKDTPLKHIVLSEAAMVLTKDGLSGPMSGFSTIGQDALKDIYGSNAANVKVDSGLNLIAAFEHKNAKGGVAGALKRLGLTEERVILTGGIGGMFGGPTKLDVDVDLSAHTGAKNQPKWMKKKPGVTSVFSLIATETAGQFDVEIGIDADILATVHGTELDFTAKTALEFEDEKIDVKIVADLKDKKGWHKPFGIPGFTLYEVGLDLGIDEDGALHLGFDGDIKVSGDTFKVAADADLLPEALGAPQDIAFKASADKVDMFFMEAIAIEMMGGNFKIDLPRGILPEFTKVKFAFVTPGAQDPDLHITGEGFALAGGMSWLDHELGSIDVAINPTKGITAAGKIDNLSLGPLELKNNDFTMKIALLGLPTLKLDSDIELLGIKERFKVAFSKTGITIDADVKFGPDFSMTSDLKLSGIDMSLKKPSFKKADFSIDGDFQMDIGKFIAGPARKSLDDVVNGLDSAFKAGEKKVKDARKKVDGLTVKINAEREKVRKEKAKAEARVQHAENRVNSLQSTIDSEWKNYHHCHGWGKWPCRIRWAVEIGGTKVAKDVADEALKLAKELISHFPIDLDPRVAVLIGERDAARDVLTLALDIIEGADALDGFLKKAVDKLTNGLKNSININKASFKGDLRDIITKDAPVDLAINAEFFGATIKDNFAISIGNMAKDLGKDVEHVALLGLYALHNLVDKGISDIPGPLKNKLKGAIAKMFDGARAKNKRRMAKYNLDFNKYNAAAELIQADYAAYSLKYILAELSKHGNPMDSDTSETISDELIEVGHSGLCLTNIDNLVKQDTCTDGTDRKWSTKPASGAAGVKAGLGYMYIIQKSTGKCIAPEGKWATVSTTVGEFTFPEQQFQGEGKINIETCVNTKEYYWKVLKHGTGWMQIANLATNKCLHFSNSNALPGKAQAEWKSCVGSANQVYRVASNITPKYHKANISLRNDAQSACFAEPNAAGEILMVDCRVDAGHYDYSIDIRGYIKFINQKTGKCLQPENYQVGSKLVERTCSQLDYQWWAPESFPGAWRIRNAQTQKCTRSPGRGAIAIMGDCISNSQVAITPITDPMSGIKMNWKNPRARPGHVNAAYPGTPDVGTCAMNDIEGSSWLTGTLMPTGKCWVALDGQQYANRGARQQFVSYADGVEWAPSGNGKLPTHAIPTGFREGPKWGGEKGSAIAYTCRTKFGGVHDNWRVLTRVGWTLDGRTCYYVYYGAHAATAKNGFEVLSRKASKAFKLDLTN